MIAGMANIMDVDSGYSSDIVAYTANSSSTQKFSKSHEKKTLGLIEKELFYTVHKLGTRIFRIFSSRFVAQMNDEGFPQTFEITISFSNLQR